MLENKNIGDNEYAEYMTAKYYNGYTDIAIFISVFLFEKYMMKMAKSYSREYRAYVKEQKNKYKEKEKKNNYRFDLNGAIEVYCKRNKAADDNELHLFRKFRNYVVHKKFQIEDNRILRLEGRDINIDNLIAFVYTAIIKKQLPSFFFKKLGKDSDQVLLQDYKIKEIDERMQSVLDRQRIKTHSKEFANFSGIDPKKFENLFELRKELLKLQLYIANNVEKIGLNKTILSPIDTTSAYIWMPFVDSSFIDSSDIIETERHNLIMGSVSILATPMDFRIYIDFGGGDINFRISYQKFLKSEQFKKYIVRYKDDDLSLKIFTTKWYSFKKFEFNLFGFIDKEDRLNKMADEALTYLAGIKAQNSIVTSGRNLIGYIFESNNTLPKELILKYFKNIAHIYYEFLIFKYPNRKNEIMKKQALLIEDNIPEENKYSNYFDEMDDDEWYTDEEI